jgi:hypothetical protein
MKPEEVMPLLRKRGLLNRLAQELGVRRQAVDAWRIVPADRVAVVAKLSGIAKHTIRPDVFPKNGEVKPIEGPRTRAAQRKLDRQEGKSRQKSA